MSAIDWVRLEVSLNSIFIEPVLSLIISYAQKLGMDTVKQEALKKASNAAISMVMDNSSGNKSVESIRINIAESQGKLIVEILNHGVPIFFNPDSSSAHLSQFHDASQYFEKVSIENLGREGQAIILEMNLGKQALEKSKSFAQCDDSLEQVVIKSEDITIRKLKAGEEAAVSRLFYFVYEYNYINEFIYYPEKLKALIEGGELISFVAALPNGRLLGHIGLRKWHDSPLVYEPCLGVVDPLVKSHGLFGNIFNKVMEEVSTIPMQYCFFDFVTNHDYSQKFIARYGTCDMAIFIGCQSSKTQAKLEKLGIGEDPKDMDRYSILYSIIPKVKHPFGHEILLPNNLGELLGFLLEPLHVTWNPSPRFSPLSSEGRYTSNCQPAQNSVLFDLVEPGRKALKDIVSHWQELLKNGYQYAGVEVPIEKGGLALVYDILAENGFFVAGIIPHHLTDKLGIRFQAIAPTKVAFDKIKVASSNGKRLLEIIREAYERNCLR